MINIIRSILCWVLCGFAEFMVMLIFDYKHTREKLDLEDFYYNLFMCLSLGYFVFPFFTLVVLLSRIHMKKWFMNVIYDFVEFIDLTIRKKRKHNEENSIIKNN